MKLLVRPLHLLAVACILILFAYSNDLAAERSVIARISISEFLKEARQRRVIRIFHSYFLTRSK